MILLIDHFDSFVHLLARLLRMHNMPCHIIRQNEMSYQQALALNPKALIFSPGPGRPEHTELTLELIAHANVPMLGICLGHQAIAYYFGGKINRARTPIHGMSTTITHNARNVFADMASPMTVGLYHALAVTDLPACLEATAYDATTGEIMAIAHKSRPIFGVQFHPESILTAEGHRIITNFLTYSRACI